MALRVRALSKEEGETLQRRIHSRTEPARCVERARIIWSSSQGERVPTIARRLEIGQKKVRFWLKRFNAEGLPGLEERPHPGRSARYTPEEVSEVIRTSLTPPQTLGLPFACWTLDRLQAYLNEVKGIAIKRSRIDELLLAEGLRWRTQETWFGERAQPPGNAADAAGERQQRPLDPAFAEKRGRSSGFTRPRLPAV
jgi:transposase